MGLWGLIVGNMITTMRGRDEEWRVPEYARVGVVGSFAALRDAPWAGGVNAWVWPRELRGDFGAVVAAVAGMNVGEEIVSLEEDDLEALALGAAGREAAAMMSEDLRCLREAGLEPSLDYLPVYPRDGDGGPVPTDVYSWHVDSAPVRADTWLCSYHEAASEGLPNEAARRRVEVPETRAALLAVYGGADDEGFAAWLREGCYDLHYEAMAGARPYGFGLGNLWRIAGAWPGCPVPPCIHRAPTTGAGRPARLLLIS